MPIQSPLSDQRIITPPQFIANHFADKIAAGECQVYLWHKSPPREASETEKQAYRLMLERHGNWLPIHEVRQMGYNSFFLITYNASGGKGTLATTADQQLGVVWGEMNTPILS